MLVPSREPLLPLARISEDHSTILEENDMMGNGSYEDEGSNDVRAFLAGALIGAGVVMLLAPQEGTELRGRLRDYAYRAKDELLNMGQETWETVVTRGMEYYHKGEETIGDVRRSAKELATQVQDVSEGNPR